MFKPYTIQLNMRTPIVPGKFPLHLDSLFYWFLSEFLHSDENVLNILDTVIARQDDVYLCSALYFRDKPKYVRCGLVHRSDAMIENLIDMNAWDNPSFVGETKMATVQAISAKKAYFNATCNKDKVEALLKKINGLGRLTNTGFGEIDSIEFVELNNDESIISSGKLMRVVKDVGLTPDQINRVDGIKDYGRYSPPYHTNSKSTIIIPKRLVYVAPTSKKKLGSKKGFNK